MQRLTPGLAGCAVALVVASCCSAMPHRAAGDQDAADAVLTVALQRALVDPRDLPDLGLIDESPEIVVRSTVPGSSLLIRPGALPKVGDRTLVLLSESEIQARAAARGDVYFVAIDDLKIAGNDAEFSIGVTVTTSPVRPMLCCCRAKVRYSRVAGTWIYEDTTERVCA